MISFDFQIVVSFCIPPIPRPILLLMSSVQVDLSVMPPLGNEGLDLFQFCLINEDGHRLGFFGDHLDICFPLIDCQTKLPTYSMNICNECLMVLNRVSNQDDIVSTPEVVDSHAL